MMDSDFLTGVTKSRKNEWNPLMDSMYEEEPWWEDKQHPRINPSHFE